MDSYSNEHRRTYLINEFNEGCAFGPTFVIFGQCHPLDLAIGCLTMIAKLILSDFVAEVLDEDSVADVFSRLLARNTPLYIDLSPINLRLVQRVYCLINTCLLVKLNVSVSLDSTRLLPQESDLFNVAHL